METEKISRRAMMDKIRLAMKDKRNGSKFAIYKRIQRTGSPFKTSDGRCKYGMDSVIASCGTLSKQTIYYRIHKLGWSVEKAVSTPLMRDHAKKGKKNGQNNRTDLPNTVLA